jgi:hypothetical protein
MRKESFGKDRLEVALDDLWREGYEIVAVVPEVSTAIEPALTGWYLIFYREKEGI